MWGTLSDERTGLPFTIAAGPRQRTHSRVRVPRDPRPYFSVSDSKLPQPGVTGPRMSSRNRMVQFYPQALGSLLVVSYYSQDYGGYIRTRLHTSKVRVKVMLRPTVSRQVSLGIKRASGP
jgi:hypothetical protein